MCLLFPRRHLMRRHQAMLVAALTAVAAAGAVALVAPSDTYREPTSAHSTAGETSTSIDSTSISAPSTASPTIAAPPPSIAAEAAAAPSDRVVPPAPTIPAATSAPSGVEPPADVPIGAEPLAIDVSPDAVDSPVAAGPEAAAWFDQASPEVRDEIAANVGADVDELAETFADDPLVFLATDGMVGYTEPALLGAAGPNPDAHAAPEPAAAPVDVLALHSRPSSTKVVYLDFDGHVMDGEFWNTHFSVDRFVNEPYDIDGDPTSFSDTERARMIEIWQRVADDFAPFDVDVTTEDPGVEGLRRTSTNDTTFGTRTVITSSDWYAPANGGMRIGGIALLNVFTSSTDHSSFVFSGNLAGGNAKSVAEAASHEAGHTFSLHHDGTSTADYYGGHNSWGPIMGTAYSRAVSHWSKGQYPGADNPGEDDLAEIASRGGVRADDHGNAAVSATPVATGTHSGLIGVDGDVDVFRVAPGSGSTQVTVTGGTNATNLLARMTVRNADGDVVITIEPASATGWSLSTVVPATTGPFTVEIVGSAWLTPETGFVAYGSMGEYTLEVADVAPPSTASSTTTTSTTATSSTSSTSSSTTSTTTAPAPPPPTDPPTKPPSTDPTPNGLALSAIAPQRIVDTRSALGGQSRQPAGGVVRVPVAGRVGIPGDARAVVANITLVQPDAPGFATVYPCTSQVPDVSVLNHATAQTVANNTIATLSGAGELCVFTSAGADILVDVTGWLGSSGTSRLVPLGPSRNVDTRSGLGGSRRVAAGSTTRFDLAAALPPRSTAIALNLTAVSPAEAGFLTAYPCGRGRPDTSSLNFAAGETRPNNAIVATDDGSVCVYADTSADILIDVTGAFGPNGLGLVAVDPVRLLDTRRSAPLTTSEVRSFSSLGSKLAPFSPRSASVNVTALDHPAPGFVSTFDCVTLRDTSTLNPSPGSVSANGAIVPLVDGDRSCLMSSSGGNLIVDLTGWWVP